MSFVNIVIKVELASLRIHSSMQISEEVRDDMGVFQARLLYKGLVTKLLGLPWALLYVSLHVVMLWCCLPFWL